MGFLTKRDDGGTNEYHNHDWSQAVGAQRIGPMIIVSALTLLAVTWLRERTAAAKPAQLAQKRAVS
jgi:hypothetical protein